MSLGDYKSPQGLLSILADFNIRIVWKVPMSSQISNSSSLFFKPLGPFQTHQLQLMSCSTAYSIYWRVFVCLSISFISTLLSAGMGKSTRRQDFFLLINTSSDHRAEIYFHGNSSKIVLTSFKRFFIEIEMTSGSPQGFMTLPIFFSPVGWGCRKRQLYLCRGVRPPPTSVLHMTRNNLMVRLLS